MSDFLEPQSLQRDVNDLVERSDDARHERAECPEDELVATMIDYQKGELDAFVRLWDSLAYEIREFLALNGSAEQELDRLLVTSFLQIHRSRHTYRAPRAVKAWAFDIARYTQAVDGGRYEREE